MEAESHKSSQENKDFSIINKVSQDTLNEPKDITDLPMRLERLKSQPPVYDSPIRLAEGMAATKN